MSKPGTVMDIGIIMASTIKHSCAERRIEQGFKQPTTLAKIKYFYKLMQELNLPHGTTRYAKNNVESKKFRESGNAMFARGSNGMSAAAELYNKAICWAEPIGEELAIAYANRSAVFFEWEEYQLCRDNIRMAKISGYPKRLMKKLDKRAAECIQFLNMPPKKKREKPMEVSLSIEQVSLQSLKIEENESYSYDKYHCEPQLDLPPHQEIPFVANCLEMKCNSEHDRCIVTNKKLVPRQIIVIESPFVHALAMRDVMYKYRKCANCYEENCLSLIPCSVCTNTMYCSEKCLIDFERYHRYECPISDVLFEYCVTETLSIRMTLKAYFSFNSTSRLEEFCKAFDKSENLIFSFDDELTDEQKCRQVHSLKTNQTKLDKSTLLQLYCKAGFLYHILTHCTTFGKIFKTKEDHNTLMELLMHYIQIVRMNAINCHQYNNIDEADPGADHSNNMYSRGIYRYASVINHSCVPNVAAVFNGSKLMLYVTRVIEEGSQLLRSYGNINYFSTDKSRRQQALSQMYAFNCECEACLKNYPAHYENLPEGKLPMKQDALVEMQWMLLDIEVKNLENFCELLKEFDFMLPCLSLNKVRIRVHRIMKLKYGDIATKTRMSFKLNPMVAAMNYE